ncbi:MAG: DUF4347 domain-containing protein [Leptolyngbya sp. IPPAS B-1204]
MAHCSWGETVVDFGDYDAELQAWSKALTADADILLYGCNVAENASGKTFVNSLSQLTGADVAASDDLTGLGGDWELEYSTGTIETTAIADATYQGTLANFTVTTLSDVVNPNDNVISLREAVNAANTLGGSNNIFFGVNGTFTLTGGELGISSNLSIFGNGASFTTISGNNASRVFNVSSGTVLLSGLTIANGRAGGGEGGGIRNSGNLTVQFCTISGNSAGGGGGIFNLSSLTVNSSTFSNNSAVFGGGGGIFNGDSLTVNSSTFSGNSGVKFGGGIFNGGSLTVNSSTLSGNSAGFGGGITNVGNLTVNSSTFSNNSAGAGGGGIYNFGVLNAVGTLFNNNGATIVGGGLFTTNEAVVDFCTFTNNQADDEGGGIFAEGVLNLGNSYFQNNRATNSGGGLYLTGSDAKVSLSTFLSNSASNGGAIGLGTSSGTSTLLVTDSVLRFNSATTSGGGIFAGAGDQVTIRRSQVRQNSAPSGVDLFGAYISGGFNLIGKGGGFTGIVNGVNGDVILVP